MLHEYREQIADLRKNNNHFARLFDEHNTLDEEINRLMNDPVAATREDEIETKKKQKLRLKDEIYRIIKENQ